MPKTDREIEQAIAVFVRGFCAGKSVTHPYEPLRVGKLWLMRDAARKNPKNYRKEEWVAYGVEPPEVDAAARSGTRGHFWICALAGNDHEATRLKAQYKELNYRLLATEPLFMHRLQRIPKSVIRGNANHSPPHKVTAERVRTMEMALKFSQATRTRPIPAEHLSDNAPFRQYVAMENGAIVGWVRSVSAGDSRWCSNMYVKPSHRRRGIGSSLLTKMLRDDRTRGAKRSVLLSSHTGALVYPRVGYEQIGLLLIYAPKRAIRANLLRKLRDAFPTLTANRPILDLKLLSQ